MGNGGVWLLSMMTGIRPEVVLIRRDGGRYYKGNESSTIRIKAEKPILLLLFCLDVSRERFQKISNLDER